MNQLIAASFGDILIACKRQLVATVDLFAIAPEHVLIANKTTVPHLKEDRDVVLQPGSFISRSPWQDGMGRIGTCFRRYMNMTPRTKVSLDETDSDEVAIVGNVTTTTAGFIPFEEACVDALCQFWPHNSSLDQLTIEPMRIADGTDPATSEMANDWRDSIVSFEVEYLFKFVGTEWFPPIITSTDPANGTLNGSYSKTFTAGSSFPGTTPFTWSHNGTLPTGLTLSSAGVLTGTCAAGGEFRFGIIVTDANLQRGIRHYKVTVT